MPFVQCPITPSTCHPSPSTAVVQIRPSRSPKYSHTVTTHPEHMHGREGERERERGRGRGERVRGWENRWRGLQDGFLSFCFFFFSRWASVNVGVWGFFGSTVRWFVNIFSLFFSFLFFFSFPHVGHLTTQKQYTKLLLKEQTETKTKKNKIKEEQRNE